MSRPPELPEDLQRLGLYLETAAIRSVRRHARRQAIMSCVGAVVIAVPFAVAVAATDLAPSDDIVPRAARTSFFSTETQAPTNRFVVRHIPDERVPAPRRTRCLDGNDCRTPTRPSGGFSSSGRL